MQVIYHCLFKVPQKQTVPVAPRTRISPEESQLEVIHVQNRLPTLSSQLQVEEPKEQTVEVIQGHLIMFLKIYTRECHFTTG